MNAIRKNVTRRMHWLICVLGLLTTNVYADSHESTIAETADANVESVQEEDVSESIETLKQQVIELNRDLFILEEDLLYPASTQLSVFLSVNQGQFFKLDSVELRIDDEVVTSYLYTRHQLEALAKGGMQRLYIGNIKKGEHDVTAVFLGQGPDKREYKRAATLSFEKDSEPTMLEIQISDQSENYQPAFSIIEWEE